MLKHMNWVIYFFEKKAAIKSCTELKKRMDPIKQKMPDADWKTLTKACFEANVDLTARH